MIGLSQILSLLPLLALTSAAPTGLVPRQDASSSSEGDVQVNDVFTPELRSALDQQLEYWRVPGAVIAVYAPERDMEGVEVFGIKDHEGTPMDGDTYLALASNTKWVTALALATIESWDNVTLANGEKFTLDSPVKDIYPELEINGNNNTEEVTVADFLSMVTGFPRHDLSIGAHDTLYDAIEKFALLKPSAPYKTPVQQYSTIHYNAMSLLPEVLIGQTLDQFVEKQIWAPLGLTGTFNATWAQETGRRGQAFNIIQNLTGCTLDVTEGQGYNESSDCRGTLDSFDFWTEGDGMEQAGGGAALMTGKDLYKWVKESINPTVIPQEALDIAYNRYNTTVTETLTYGLGVNQRTATGDWFHTGALPGHNSAFHRNLEKEIGVFVIVNQDPHGFLLADAFATYVLQALAGEEPTDLTPILLQNILGPYGLPTANETESDGGNSTESAKGPSDPSEAGEESTNVRPEDPRPLPDGIDITGTYISPGYPTLTFEPINMTDLDAVAGSNISINAVVMAASEGIDLTGPSWLGTWDSSWTTHFLLTHFDGPQFNYTVMQALSKIGELTDEGTVNTTWISQPGDHTTIKYFGVGPAVFVPEEGENEPAGFGTFSPFWGIDAIVPTEFSETEVRENAAAFFVKQ